MYEKREKKNFIRDFPLKMKNFFKKSSKFTSKKFRAAAQKFSGTPLGKKQLQDFSMWCPGGGTMYGEVAQLTFLGHGVFFSIFLPILGAL